MKISDALILGSMMHPKAIGFRHTPDGSSCALGAIEDAVGCQLNKQFAEDFFHCIYSQVIHPHTGDLVWLGYCIATLNNGGVQGNGKTYEPWSRERIARWINTVVPAAEQEMVQAKSRTNDAAIAVGV